MLLWLIRGGVAAMRGLATPTHQMPSCQSGTLLPWSLNKPCWLKPAGMAVTCPLTAAQVAAHPAPGQSLDAVQLAKRYTADVMAITNLGLELHELEHFGGAEDPFLKVGRLSQ